MVQTFNAFPGERMVSEAQLKQTYARQMVEVPGTQKPGQTAHYRNALAPQLLDGFHNAKTMYEAFNHGMKVAGPSANCLGRRLPIGTDPSSGATRWSDYVWLSWAEVDKRRTELGSGFVNIWTDVIGGDVNDHFRIGVYGFNRLEWVLTDIAMHAYSLVNVAVFDTLGAESLQYIINHAELAILVTTSEKVPNIVNLVTEGKVPTLKVVILMDNDMDAPAPASAGTGAISRGNALRSWADQVGIKLFSVTEVMQSGQKHPRSHRPPAPTDVLALSYTSGTTGNPKGATLTHRNLTSVSGGTRMLGFDFTPADVHMCYLPLAHIFERANLAAAYYGGVQIGFPHGDFSTIFEDLALLKPTAFESVPRVYNRIYSAVLAKTVHSESKVTAALFKRAYEEKKNNLLKYGHLKHAIWDRLIFSKIQQLMGGRVRSMLSGSAPINPEVLQFLRIVFSCEVFEGYGQTETAAGGSLTWRGDYFGDGTVGPVVPPLELKLVDIPEMNYLSTDPLPRGEICFRGHAIFAGYYKDKKKTDETIDEEGWHHTGDVGQITERLQLKIIDRKKHIFKLAQGEYVAPERLENLLINSELIAQVYVHGDSLESELVAIVVPDWQQATKKGIAAGLLPKNTPVPEPGLPGEAPPAHIVTLAKDPRFAKFLLDDFAKIGRANKLAGYEIPKRVFVDPELMSEPRGLLTPTMKVKRETAKEFYLPQIKEMYASIGSEKTLASEGGVISSKL
ncbi:hypothetical protein BJ742DRAFT_805837 [Cladochytrium replicatum]|nr:hypothetical protein BJ742DRAFT_805837 [Cladochytrium replicatum]